MFLKNMRVPPLTWCRISTSMSKSMHSLSLKLYSSCEGSKLYHQNNHRSPSGNFTYGFPERDGLIMIDEEIIYYEYKTEDIFENCSRGFSAVTSYDEGPVRDKLSFTETMQKHTRKVQRLRT